MVHVHAGPWLAGQARGAILRVGHAAAQGVIEHEHPVGARRFAGQRLRFRIIHPADFVLVPKVDYGALMLDESEPFPIQCEGGCMPACVLDGDALGCVLRV